MSSILRFLAFAAAMAACVAAQPVDRTKPPRTPPIPPYKLPPVSETTLRNGLKIVLVEDARYPLVTARLNFMAGSRFDPTELPGLAEAVASLLTEGTASRTARQFSEEVDAIGGSVGAAAGPDALTVAGNALSENTGKLLDLMADAALHAEFPAGEVDLYKRNRAESLKAERADPAFLAEEKRLRLIYGTTPYGHMTATLGSIAKLDAAKLAAYRDARLTPENATLTVLGRLPAHGELMKVITDRFAGWERRAAPAPGKIAPPPPRRQIVLVDRPGSVQADIHVARLAPPRNSPDFFPMLVASDILGAGAASRLFRDVRERDGYAYDAHTEYATQRDAAMLTAVTQVRNEVIEPALREVLAEVDGVFAKPIPPAELTHVKDYMCGMYVLRLETQEGIAAQLDMIQTLGLPKDYLETYTSKVRSVTAMQVQAAARRYLSTGLASIVVIGDASKIAEPLKKFGPVRVEAEK
ncbi:MAG TPA: pitrilysin family protein [Candidatus Limnocylindrales bacterium]|nr:pitrilysin family protein [Candidatus Limnocylindrales bacterium]